MGGFVSYAQLNSLEEFSFIAGTNFKLAFSVYEEDGTTPVDLGGGSVRWVLCPYGQPDYTVLDIEGDITGVNTFEVDLDSELTIELSGKFIQQPVVTDFDQQIFRPAQGVILILPAIPTL